jgi:hypothetical protein
MKLNVEKLILCLSLLSGGVINVSAQLSPAITSWIRNTTNATGYGGILSNVQIVQYDTSNVYVSCTCIPGYSIGPWNTDPNIPSNQNFVFKITLHPEQNTGNPVAVGLGAVGVWSNGVAVYDASDGMTYNNDGTWHRNAYYFEGISFDDCLGHPDQSGCYHHHVNPKCLYNDSDNTQHSPIIGYAFDGYPIYGAYGYSNPNGSGGIRRMRTSYQLRTNMVNRDTLPNGTILTSAKYGPAVSSSYPLGDFLEDYIYIPNSGDLDSNNGRFCVTPDYPSGIYAYFVTIDSTLTPVYPYVLGLTYKGVVQSGNTGPGSGHNTPTDSTIVYTSVSNVKKQINLTLDPNPVIDYAYFYIDPSSDNNIAGGLYDTNGKLLKSYKNLQPSMSYSIDFTCYPAGVYFLRLQTSNTSFTKKIVKMQ